MPNSANKVIVKYDYSYFSKNDNQNVEIKVGQEYDLITKASKNWWFVSDCRQPGHKIYVPAAYVQELSADDIDIKSESNKDLHKDDTKIMRGKKPAPLPKSAKVLERMSLKPLSPASAEEFSSLVPDAFKDSPATSDYQTTDSLESSGNSLDNLDDVSPTINDSPSPCITTTSSVNTTNANVTNTPTATLITTSPTHPLAVTETITLGIEETIFPTFTRTKSITTPTICPSTSHLPSSKPFATTSNIEESTSSTTAPTATTTSTMPSDIIITSFHDQNPTTIYSSVNQIKTPPTSSAANEYSSIEAIAKNNCEDCNIIYTEVFNNKKNNNININKEDKVETLYENNSISSSPIANDTSVYTENNNNNNDQNNKQNNNIQDTGYSVIDKKTKQKNISESYDVENENDVRRKDEYQNLESIANEEETNNKNNNEENNNDDENNKNNISVYEPVTYANLEAAMKKSKMTSSGDITDYANMQELHKSIWSKNNEQVKTDNPIPAGYVRISSEDQTTKGPSQRSSLLSLPSSLPKPSLTSSLPKSSSPSKPPTSSSVNLLEPKFVEKRGLIQKTKYESGSKKIKKSWTSCFAVLVQSHLYFYKESKASSKKQSNPLGKPEMEVDLGEVQVAEPPVEKNNKKNAFMLQTSNSTHHILHHEDEEVCLHWKDSIINNMHALQAGLPLDPPIYPKTLEKPASRKASESNSVDGFKEDKYNDRKMDGWKDRKLDEGKRKIAFRLVDFLLRRPSKQHICELGIYKEVVFGSSIVNISTREKRKMPRFVSECILAVEKRGLHTDGIYRVSSNMASVQKLRNRVDMNEYYDLTDPSWDVHTITGALKLFFRELSEPLFSTHLYHQFIQATNNVDDLRTVIKKLPSPNACTMKTLFKHLHIVLQHSTHNRMQAQGLAIVFGPTLLWSADKVADDQLAYDVIKRGQLVEFMVKNCNRIFD